MALQLLNQQDSWLSLHQAVPLLPPDFNLRDLVHMRGLTHLKVYKYRYLQSSVMALAAGTLPSYMNSLWFSLFELKQLFGYQTQWLKILLDKGKLGFTFSAKDGFYKIDKMPVITFFLHHLKGAVAPWPNQTIYNLLSGKDWWVDLPQAAQRCHVTPARLTRRLERGRLNIISARFFNEWRILQSSL